MGGGPLEVSSTLPAVVVPTDRHAEVDEILGQIRAGECVKHYATVRERTDGTVLQVSVTASPIYDERGVVGLAAALRVLATQTAREVGAEVDVRGDVGRYDHVVEELMYRSAQEALANVRRHARPHHITVTLEQQADMLSVEITDDGRGFDIAGTRSRPGAALHLGLDTLVERVRAAGGHAEITSTAGDGTQVRIAAPTRPVLTETAEQVATVAGHA